jgi:hypothetical protein
MNCAALVHRRGPPSSKSEAGSRDFARHIFHWSGSRRHLTAARPWAGTLHLSAHPLVRRCRSRDQRKSLWPVLGRSAFGASDLTGILGRFDRTRQSRRFFNMFGGLVRLVIGLHQLRLRSLTLFFDRRFPRHFGFSMAFTVPTSVQRIGCGTCRRILEQGL